MNKNVAFLLGAGSSVAVGMSPSSLITERILSEDNLRTTHRQFINLPPNKSLDTSSEEYAFSAIPYLPETAELLNRLKTFANYFNTHCCWNKNMQQQPKKEVNYEDLFFMLMQIYDHEISNVNIYGSILSKCVIDDEFRKRIEKAVDAQSRLSGDFGVIGFLENVERYMDNSLIKIITSEQNKITQDDINQLKIIVDSITDGDIQIENIFSLNHDTIIEKLLQMNYISYCDGHEDTIGKSNLRRWNPELFDGFSDKCKETHIRLMKLHGSINRRYFNRVDENSGPPVLGIYTGEQKFEKTHTIIKDVDNVEYHFPDNPRILIGTENKSREYLVTDYWDLFSRFRRYLFNEVDVVVACGYSFGDLPVNAQLLEWLINHENKKLIIVNNEDEWTFKGRIDEQLRNYMVRETADKFHYIEVDIAKLSWQSLKEQIINNA